MQRAASGAASDPRLTAMSLAALGIVFGDIGTSPLYTLKTVLDLTGAHPTRRRSSASLSLIFWTLFLITTVKYVNFAMRVDNDGEGGILALMSLLGVKKRHRPVIVAVGLFGAALIYGDGAITPAISVLSALEGLDIVTPSLAALCVPAAVGDPARACSRSSRRARRASAAPSARSCSSGSSSSRRSASTASLSTRPCSPRSIRSTASSFSSPAA